MINIVFFVTPNYKNKTKQINVIYKKIDIIDQFIIAYNSIKKNWKNNNYDISLFYNKNMPFNNQDNERLSNLDINIIPCVPDHPKIPYLCRCSALTYGLPKKGTHRLILDSDILLLKEPIFNLNCDWQAMFAGSALIPNKDIEYINQKYNFNLNLKKYKRSNLFINYIKNPKKYVDLFPHFNAGAYLIREELCNKFVALYKDCYNLAFDKNIKSNHIAIQYAQSFALIKLSKNWEPFIPGINYLGKVYDINKFGKDNIILFHYCGKNGENNVYKYFNGYLI